MGELTVTRHENGSYWDTETEKWTTYPGELNLIREQLNTNVLKAFRCFQAMRAQRDAARLSHLDVFNASCTQRQSMLRYVDRIQECRKLLSAAYEQYEHRRDVLPADEVVSLLKASLAALNGQ